MLDYFFTSPVAFQLSKTDIQFTILLLSNLSFAYAVIGMWIIVVLEMRDE